MDTYEDFSVTVDVRDKAVIISVAGEVDVATAPGLRSALDDVALSSGTPKNLVIDMTAVSFLDSTALGVLVSALRKSEEHGVRFGVVLSHPHVIKVFRVTNLDSLMTVHPTLEAALSPGVPSGAA